MAATLVTVGLMSLLAISPLGGVYTPAAPSFSAVGGVSHGSVPTAAIAVSTSASAGNATVIFKEIGLPSGSSWSVSAGSPAVTQTNTTVGHRGELIFSEPNGTLNYSISAPAGFSIEKIVGRGQPSQTSDLVNGTTVLTVRFSAFEQLSFQEIGLPTGSVWSVAIWSSFPHGGPGGHSGSDTVTSAGGWINFTVVRGPWKYNVTGIPANFTAYPSHGTVGVGAHNVTRDLKFRPTHHNLDGLEAIVVVGIPRGIIARPA